MPLYDVRCATCGNVEEVFRSYDQRDTDLPECCGSPMPRTFLPPQVMRDIDGYQSIVDGTFISSRSQHREHLKRHNLRELGNDMPDVRPRARSIPRAAIREEIRNTVERMKAQGTFRER